jgi:hypothetical protein
MPLVGNTHGFSDEEPCEERTLPNRVSQLEDEVAQLIELTEALQTQIRALIQIQKLTA